MVRRAAVRLTELIYAGAKTGKHLTTCRTETATVYQLAL